MKTIDKILIGIVSILIISMVFVINTKAKKDLAIYQSKFSHQIELIEKGTIETEDGSTPYIRLHDKISGVEILCFKDACVVTNRKWITEPN